MERGNWRQRVLWIGRIGKLLIRKEKRLSGNRVDSVEMKREKDRE